MRILTILFAIALAQTSTTEAFAHEFWLSPERYQVAPGDPLTADIRVGQNFKGAAYSYLPGNTARFEMIGAAPQPVKSRMGDRPALAMTAPKDGLLVIVHETTDSTLTYHEWDKFVSFVEHKAFADALETHAARALPQTGFVESYRRYAKSLVAVGDGKGADLRTGMETEIVALANPYTDDMTGGLPVEILYQDAPRPGAQLEVFDKAPDGTVTDTRVSADAQGRVRVPVAAGHEYLLDAVVLRDTGNDDPAAGPVWHSLWASLTFRMPGK